MHEESGPSGSPAEGLGSERVPHGIIERHQSTAPGASEPGPWDPSPTPRFPIGSVSKLLTALLAVRLHISGRVDWDEPLATSAPRSSRSISVRQLLGHTAGMPFELRPDHWDASSLSELELAAACATPPSIDLPPGSWHYSNLGYGMVAHALTAATGMPYVDLMLETVTGPLGMERTSLPDPATEGAPILGAAYAAGDFWSTTSDLLLLGAALDVRDDDVITGEAWRLLLNDAVPAADGRLLGPGFTVSPVGPHRVITSHGTLGGHTTCLVIWPRRGTSVLVTTRGHSADELRRVGTRHWSLEPTGEATWWLDGQRVHEVESGNRVELLLEETSWPFPLFAGARSRGDELVGVDWAGRDTVVARSDGALWSARVRLVDRLDHSAFQGSGPES